ncbi:MAG: 1,6-anhydro-N-acetylmuramyl-L-alanine amidase AmpD, partial [Propionivibrio sp.]
MCAPTVGDANADSGWLPEALRIASPNADWRPAATPVSLLVIHAISLPPGQFGSDDIVRLFTNTLDPNAHPYFSSIHTLRVSSHFLIRRDGLLIQFVSCERRAWHAGVSSWAGRSCCNDFSIGIELEGCDELPFADVQYARLIELIANLRAHYPIDTIVGHADIAPERKSDPG